jgi:hypothetical protein
MTAVAMKGSSGFPGQLFKQSEVAGAKTTYLFHLALTADGADATGLVPVVTISKAGGAFGAAAGVVSELSGGWYKIVFTAADLNTLGALGIHVAVATADTINEVAQVQALDPYTATVNPGAGGITAASFAAGAIDAAAIAADALGSSEAAASLVTEVQSGLATAAGVAAIDVGTKTVNVGLGTRTTDGDFTAKSMRNAIRTVITVTGTWDGATVTGYVCADPTATVPAWIPAGTPITANGTITIDGPAEAFKATVSNDGAGTSLTATAAIVKAAQSE